MKSSNSSQKPATKPKNHIDLLSAIKKLHVYCQEGNLPLITELLEKNPEILNSQNEAGNSALIISLKFGHLHLFRYFIDSFPNDLDLNLKNNVFY